MGNKTSPRRLAAIQRSLAILDRIQARDGSLNAEAQARRARLQAELAAWGSTASAAVIPASEGTGLLQSVEGGLASVKQALGGIPTPALLAGGAVIAGAAATAGVALASRRRKRKSSRRSRRKGGKSKSRPGSRQSRATGRGPGKRNRRGGAVKDRYKGHRVYRTKRGQPYILLSSGKARFVRA